MQQLLFQEKYPVRLRRYDKKRIRFHTLEELCQYFRETVEKHPFARYIDTFDHYSHTTGLSDGLIDSSIVGAKHVMFCFGKKLENPEVLSVRPRSIGIGETESQFVISFLEPPSATATATMEQWVCGLAQPASTVEHKRAEGGQGE